MRFSTTGDGWLILCGYVKSVDDVIFIEILPGQNFLEIVMESVMYLIGQEFQQRTELSIYECFVSYRDGRSKVLTSRF